VKITSSAVAGIVLALLGALSVASASAPDRNPGGQRRGGLNRRTLGDRKRQGSGSRHAGSRSGGTEYRGDRPPGTGRGNGQAAPPRLRASPGKQNAHTSQAGPFGGSQPLLRGRRSDRLQRPGDQGHDIRLWAGPTVAGEDSCARRGRRNVARRPPPPERSRAHPHQAPFRAVAQASGIASAPGGVRSSPHQSGPARSSPPQPAAPRCQPGRHRVLPSAFRSPPRAPRDRRQDRRSAALRDRLPSVR